MKMDKEKFLKTELGVAMLECVKSWDMALSIINRYNGCKEFYDAYQRAKDVVKNCQVQWEVYQTAVRQCYNVDIYFTRVDKYFGIEMAKECSEYLFKCERKDSGCLSV